MNEDSFRDCQWVALAIPNVWSDIELTQVLASCGHALVLRLSQTPEGISRVEVYCKPGEEVAKAEALFQQALADRALRRAIVDQCDPQLGLLVDSVLARAVKG